MVKLGHWASRFILRRRWDVSNQITSPQRSKRHSHDTFEEDGAGGEVDDEAMLAKQPTFYQTHA